jgi:twitching motility protein PilT
MNDITRQRTGLVISSAGQPPTEGHGMGEARLSQINFTDLYISEIGQVLIGGAEDSEGPLVEVPDGAISDVDSLRIIVMQKGQTAKEFFIDYDAVRYRVTRIKTVDVTWYTLRKSMTVPPKIKDLLGEKNKAVLRHLGWLGEEPQKGLILLAGPVNQGKTTTACSLLLQYLVAFGKTAVTIEDPPEMKLNGRHGKFGLCLQRSLEPGETFGSALVDAMRQTPRFILVGEMRRPEDASEVLRTAISGHVVISTIHAGDPLEAINSLIKLVSAKDGSHEYACEQVANGLSGVIHQRLHRVKHADGKFRPHLELNTLFMGLADSKERTTIRDGNIGQLGSSLERQAELIKKNQDPVLPEDYLKNRRR